MSDLLTLRRGVGLSRPDLQVVRYADWAAVDPLIPTRLDLREGRLRQGLLLHEDGRPRADLLLGCDQGELLVLGQADTALSELLGPPTAVLHDDHAVLSVDGPFAWELLAAWDNPGLIGLPYLGSFRPQPDTLVLRAGRTGEYGYLLLVPRARAEGIWSELLELGQRLQARPVGAEALREAAFESWIWELADSGDLDALELQLRWRVDLRREAPGLDALRAHKAAGLRRRLTAVRASGPVAAGDPLTHEGRVIGRALRAHGPLATVAIDRPFYEVGVTDYLLGGQPCATVSAPFVLQRSLFINPQRHDHASRHDIELPPGVAGGEGW